MIYACRMFFRLPMGLIVAVDEAGGIGKDGAIPWQLRKDMAHFVKKTKDTEDINKRNAVIMGRKCYESIPPSFLPLKGRLNVVISRTLPEMTGTDLLIRSDINKAMDELASLVACGKIERVWNIGGGEIYSWALRNDLINTIEITKIQKNFGADVKLPDIEWENFKEVCSSEEQEENGVKFTFHTYEQL